MDLGTIVSILVGLAVVILLYVILGRAIRFIVRIVAGVAMVALVIGGVILYADIKDFQNDLATQPVRYILADTNRALGAFEVTGTNTIAPLATLDSVSQALARNDIAAVQNGAKVLFILSPAFVKKTPLVLYNDDNLTGDQALIIFQSRDAVSAFANLLPSLRNYPPGERLTVDTTSLGSDEEFRANLLAAVVSAHEGTQIISEIAAGTLTVHPDRLLFKIVRSVPDPSSVSVRNIARNITQYIPIPEVEA